MKHIATSAKRGTFNILLRSRSTQAAKMTLAPGATSDDEVSNEHPSSEQWLFVISGSGEAVIGTRQSPLRTIKLYAPPAYDPHGDPL
jgi:mannose-6-phosphate isomerase-like protein (cupin superfamily)